MKKFTPVFFLLLISVSAMVFSQDKRAKATAEESKDPLTESTFKAFKLRSIGPAMLSGRVADIAIHPEDDNIWYVAVGSGGVWKTNNAGVTWESIFDGQGSYSIGCVTIDPNNPKIVWVGTGENVGGRHVGYGDGIYKSEDGGKTWANMGLKNSEHISKIIIHPDNKDVVWVASQGPLWAPAGDRGVFKTTDGGKNWEKQLGDDQYTGATDIIIDPRDPDVLYAATWQHHRTVAAYMGGGPKTAIYKTEDGGNHWEKLDKGLPKGNMGKIGMAISPMKPDVVYAAIELDRRTGGVYRSSDSGASWKKMSDAVSGGTGPHYYQELYASPHAFDRIYLCDVRIQVSDDGGNTFRRLKEQGKHSDNHVMAFREDDPDYLLIGSDGGVDESFDLGENWRFMNNLPVTQFYKVAVDDRKPFYYVFGGTQDVNTQGGPSRTDRSTGILNCDWEIVVGGDGHQPATEPGNPNIMYAEAQQGYLSRIDRKTGQTVFIQPQPDKGEPAERFNWDSPILVSPHNPTTILFASQRVWKSDDRGDSWEAISGDLTQYQERITLPIMGKKQSWDAPWDMYAMSVYHSITSLSESPKKEGLIYAGTDDGLLQVTEDGGENWRKIEISTIPGVPELAFINDVKADLFDENIVYMVLDNHKYGDLNPYLVKSTDKGKTWKSIVSNLPERTLLWRIVQDHVNPDLLFVGTEFGVYFTIDGGEKWIKITGDAPTISFRDLAIQRRENDLVGATFGRGFYILDDYAPLREIKKEDLNKEAALYSVRDAWWYFPKRGKGSQGAARFVAKNPPYGAVFTIYLKDDIKTIKDLRQEKEKELQKTDADIPFPGWEKLDEEKNQEAPMLLLTVKDSEGNLIRKLKTQPKKGFQRIAWDLRYPSMGSLTDNDRDGNSSGMLVAPGEFSVSLSKEVDGVITDLAGPVSFHVNPLRKGTLEGSPYDVTVAFWKELAEFRTAFDALQITLNESLKKTDLMQTALQRSDIPPGKMNKEIHDLKMDLIEIRTKLTGNASKNEIGEKNPHTISRRLSVAASGTSNSAYGPTPTHRKSLEIAKEEFAVVKNELEDIVDNRMPLLLQNLYDAGAPWIEGMPIPEE
ncbi:MAG: WD40/YVTN/BNR-like repeat-containing protein [Bacteroidota bacterium]